MVLDDFSQQITKAISYLDEPNKNCDEATLKKIVKDAYLVLFEFDVNVKQVSQFKENVVKEYQIIIESQFSANNMNKQSSTNINQLIKQTILKQLTGIFDVPRNNLLFKPVKNQQSIVMFTGMRRAGKTTTIMKYASYWKRLGWKVGIVCAETTKPNESNSFMTNHGKPQIPFYGSYDEIDSVKIAQNGVEMFKKDNYEIIIVDTCGICEQEADQANSILEQIKTIQSSVKSDECILVVDGSLGQASCSQVILAKTTIHISSVILTKIDGNKKGPGAISSIASLGIPITFIGTGEHISDLEPFEGSQFIQRIISQNTKISLPITFQLRQLKEQLQDVLKIEPIRAILKIIPFFKSFSSDNEQEQIEKIKRYIVIMESMNDEELDGQVEFSKSRIERIAQDSGTTVEDVNELLKQFKRFSNICISCNHLNQHNIKNQAIDPKILQAMDGKEGLMKMMKQLGDTKFIKK